MQSTAHTFAGILLFFTIKLNGCDECAYFIYSYNLAFVDVAMPSNERHGNGATKNANAANVLWQVHERRKRKIGHPKSLILVNIIIICVFARSDNIRTEMLWRAHHWHCNEFHLNEMRNTKSGPSDPQQNLLNFRYFFHPISFFFFSRLFNATK